ncbi:MAG: hypothetical protein KBD53_04850 [Candidatus Omnitrophica bacterium]|nr:hypothetical protein [Candidatus Omnitrophota bacterium]
MNKSKKVNQKKTAIKAIKFESKMVVKAKFMPPRIYQAYRQKEGFAFYDWPNTN